MKASRTTTAVLALAVSAAALAAGAVAGDSHGGFKTTQPSMLTGVASGSTVTPLDLQGQPK